ncbi:hypothetical protein AFK68_00975, partial [Hydrocoleum sp. CS-953]|uniref:hypothetical protein n=1 Tax=Hydrocoleum sp. CS-953 TaxID=1671698 RepID=UPI000BC62DA1
VINHNNPNSPNAQFTPELLSNGNYGLKNTEKYVRKLSFFPFFLFFQYLHLLSEITSFLAPPFSPR